MTDVKRIIVTTNADNLTGKTQSQTTLRDAIHKINQWHLNPETRDPGGSAAPTFYIDFEARNESNKNFSWIIEPEMPLPPLLGGKVYFNYNNSKNVIVSGSKLKTKKPIENETYKSNIPFKANLKSSLLTIGDAARLNDWKYVGRRRSKTPDPNIYIKNVNFTNNIAKGEDGTRGAGGALGAGGGITVVQKGKIQVENAVFQNLTAKGGIGGKRAKGGNGGYMRDINQGPANGTSGQNGGDSTKQGSYVTYLPCELAGRAAGGKTMIKGGKGGAPGDTDKGYKYGKDEYLNGHRGEDASEFDFLSGCSVYGRGGAGGGGGGGASPYFYYWTGNHFGNGGYGGKGSDGAWGGGAGAGGKGGSRCLVTDPAESLNGGNGKNGYAGRFASAASGSSGGDGAALGGSIALLHPEAKLSLINVDFINSKASAGSKAEKYNILYSQDEYNKVSKTTSLVNQVSGKSIKYYQDFQKQNGDYVTLDTDLKNQDFHSHISKINSNYAQDIYFEGASYNRNDQLANIRNENFVLQPGKAESVKIRFEQIKSTITPIDINSSQIEQAINDIYKKIIPIESNEDIKERMKQKMIASAIQLGSSIWGARGVANNLFKASNGTITEDMTNQNIGLSALGAYGSFISSIINARGTYNKEIARNNANIKELAEKTENGRYKITARPIDIKQARSLVTINNFTLGEDTLYFEDFGKKEDGSLRGPKFTTGSSSLSQSGKQQSVDVYYDDQSNTNSNNRIANIQLDPKSTASLTESAEEYLRKLLTYDTEKGRWQVSTMLTDKLEIFQKGEILPTYFGGPAAELKILERNGIANQIKMTTNTQNYNDIIYGTDGYEVLNTAGGNDQLYPGLGIDTINGGNSFDIAHYQNLEQPIDVYGTVESNINSDQNTQINQFQVKLLNKTSGVLNSTLSNMEGITAFDNSRIDLSELSEPDALSDINLTDKSNSYYLVRSGVGSKITGSDFDDVIIISHMDDENSSSNLNQGGLGISSSNIDKIVPLTPSSKPFSKVHPIMPDYFTVMNVSTIAGGDGDNLLKFAFDGKAPNNFYLAYLNNTFPIPGLEGYNAVINDRTIIAYIKDFNVSNIEVLGSAEYSDNGVLKFNDVPINIKTISSKMLRTDLNAVQQPWHKVIPVGSNESDTFGTNNHDFIQLNATDNVVKGANGKDLILGLKGQDTLYGGTNHDILIGGNGSDALIGGAGHDRLIGNRGEDKIDGGRGSDIIYGGQSKNILSGGSGYDTFHLQTDGNQDIVDFDPYQDSLQISEAMNQDNLRINSENQILHNESVIATLF